MVYSGVQGAPVANYLSNATTVLPTTPVSREKPYLYVDSSSNWWVFVPSPQTNSVGPTWTASTNTPGYSIPIANFYIATPSSQLSDINNALAMGQNLILTPGIYQYSGSIDITNPNTIVLGLGYATLIPQAGNAAIAAADVDGVQIAGLIVDAGPVSSPVLLQIGVPGSARVSHQQNPITLNDMVIRIGGEEAGTAATGLEIDSDNVIIDNLWAWRADHGAGASPIWTGNPANHGVVVNGDNVTALGLAVEHFEQNQVVWNGNGGETIFYQSEIPYDVPSQAAWMNGTANGYSSYSVSAGVTSHAAYGLGVYSYFDQGIPIIEDNAITVPNAPDVTVTDATSIFLAGSGQITASVDGVGTVAKSGQIKSMAPFYQGTPCTANCTQAPTNLQAYVIAPTQINLSWTPSATPGAVYSVYRSTTPGFTPSTANLQNAAVSASTYADTGLSASTTYYYVVEAQGQAGFSQPSNQAFAVTSANQGGTITNHVIAIDAGASAPPTGWVADADYSGGTNGYVNHAVTLVNNDYATQAVYQYYRKTSGTCTYNGATYQICYLIPGFTPGAAYVVNLHFADMSYGTANSRAFNVQINGTQVLTNFDIAATTGGEYIATVQSFYGVADSNGYLNVTLSNGSHNNPIINGIEIGTGSLATPATPTNFSAVSGGDEVTLYWNSVSGSNIQYEVFRGTSSSVTATPANLLTTTDGTAFTDTNVTPGTTYYYLVVANNTLLTSNPTKQASVSIPANTAGTPIPAAPSQLAAGNATASQISLLWTGSATPNVQYLVYRSTTASFTPGSGNEIAGPISATGYTDTGLIGATTYYYVVEANNSEGDSQPSNTASATTTGTAAAAPTFSVTAGTYTTTQTVSIGDTTPNATIYYTLDGSTPTTSSAVYSGGTITVSSTETIQAIAVATGYFQSALASATYTITPPAATPTFTVAAGTYLTSQTVGINDTTAGVTIYYSLDGSTPTTNSAVYSKPLTVSTPETIKAIASGDGYSASGVASATFNIVPAAPTFSPGAGAYAGPTSVSLSDSAAGASIYYTTDSSTPSATNGKLYQAGNPIALTPGSTTLKAVAAFPGVQGSTVSSAVYNVSPAAPTFSPNGGTISGTTPVTLSDATTGATIYYTTDGTMPNASSAVYKSGSPISVSTTETIKAIAIAGGYSSSAASATFTINYPATATPTFSPSGGTYNSPQAVSIGDTTQGATIYYTTDGTTPTTASAKYSATISVSTSEALQAIAVAPQHSQSAVASTSYNIVPSTLTLLTSAQIGTSVSGLAYSHATQTFSGTMTITNIGKTTISGPIQIVFTQLPSGITLANETGTYSGAPFITVPQGLAPAQSVTVNLQFKNPSNVNFSEAAAVYSGSF